jgi:hypothetical protein
MPLPYGSNAAQDAHAGVGGLPSVRYSGLDALRALAMFLGLWVHGILLFTEYARPVVHDPLLARSAVFFHAFRMPLFFVLAGFFSNLLVGRRGWWRFGKNRALRIALPLAVSGLTIIPVMSVLWPVQTTGWIRWWPSFYHLWFLQYLLLIYLAAAVVAKFIGVVGDAQEARRLEHRRRAVGHLVVELAADHQHAVGLLHGAGAHGAHRARASGRAGWRAASCRSHGTHPRRRG